MRQVAHLCGVINNVDRFLAITGNLWVDTLSKSRYSHWAPRITNLDIGIDPSEFPRIKNSFNAQDSRRFLYIGHTDWMKNTSYLSQIASLMPNTQFSWMGRGKHGINGLKSLGYQDFRSQDSKDLVATHDFVITVSTADANPATVIEAMAWGLIPVCTPQCGYVNFPGIPLIPLNNAVEAVRVLQSLQAAPVEELIRIRDQNSELIRTQFTWDEFTRKVITAVEAVDRPRLYPPPATLRIISWIAWTASLLSPRAWRPLIKARTIPKGR
jgi:glycosyltransferase involved in cell wall biosynthesis